MSVEEVIGIAVVLAIVAAILFLALRQRDREHRELMAALEAGAIAGAALDVFEVEPLPAESPLWSQPNLVLTPHVSGMVEIYVEQTMPILKHNIRAFLEGRTSTMLNLIGRQT